MSEGERLRNGRFAPGTSGNIAGRKPRHPKPEALSSLELPDRKRLDAWVSFVTGLGTGARDKRSHTHHEPPRMLSYEEVARLWETDDMGARGIEAPGTEVFREGYEIVFPSEGSYSDLKESTEEKLQEDLGLDSAIETIMSYERAYGGGAVLLGVDDGRPLDEPMDTTRVKSLDWLNVLEPIELQPAQYYEDPNQANYGRPEFYQLYSTGFAGPMIGLGTTPPLIGRTPVEYVHESRMIVFGGIRVSKRIRSMNVLSQYWGTPQILRFVESLRDFHITWGNAGILATDFAQPVISIPNLLALIAKDPAVVQARVAAMEMTRSNARALLIDAKEQYQRVTTNLSGLPELLDRISLRLAAALGMPLSVMMGYSPEGLGKPGSVEMTQWYNIIRSIQRRRVGPVIRKVTRLLTSTLRKRKAPKSIKIQWNELERLSDAQRIEARLGMARVDSLNIKSGMITPDEARRSRWAGGFSWETTIDPTKKAPGSLELIPKMLVPGVGPQVPIAAMSAASGAGAQAPNGAKTQTAHTVRGYARKNPTGPKNGPNPTVGGDKANGRENRDALYTAEIALGHQRDVLQRALDGGASAEELEHLERATDVVARAAKACSDGTCGENCPYDHPLNLGFSDWSRIDERMVQFGGLPIVIENEKGSTRKWVDTDGTPGESKMRYAYGYIHGTQAADGEGVDVYLGPNEHSEWAYIIHQQSKASGFKLYDEDKVMLGFDSPNHARDAYLNQYDDERFLGSMSQMKMEDFHRRMTTRIGMISNSQHDLIDESEIIEHLDRIEHRGDKWVVLSEDGSKELGSYDSETLAIKRLAQVEFYKKHHGHTTG